jgi:tRNA pseudouridine55 synthase
MTSGSSLMTQYEGIILCHKPHGITSHDLINKLRRAVGQKRIGHTGTLDPRATGLMIICLGRATKIAQFLTEIDKTYEAEIKLGQRSTTYDTEGILKDDYPKPIPEMSEKDVKRILKKFIGKSKQKPPKYSAIKIGGQRLYNMARRGKNVDPPEREIEIKEIELISMRIPRIEFRVVCSKGTYIRTLAHDIGEKIGCGAYLSKLARTRIGDYNLDDALSVNEIKHYREAGILKKFIQPIEKVLNFPSIQVTEKFTPAIISGKSPLMKDITEIVGDFKPEELISLKDHNGKIRAVGKSEINSAELNGPEVKQFFKYVRVLN